MLVGQGALDATDEVDRRRQSCSAPASRRRSWARRRVPDDLPFVTGSIGLLGTKPSYEMMTGCDTLLDGRLELPVRGVPAQGRRGTRRADRPRRAHARHPLPDGRPPRRRRRGDAAGARAAARAEDGPLVAGADRARGRRLVAGARRAGAGRGRPRQSRSASSRSSRRGCPTAASSRPTRARCASWYARAPAHPSRDEGVALGDACHHGLGRAIRDRGEVRASRPRRRSRSSATGRCR